MQHSTTKMSIFESFDGCAAFFFGGEGRKALCAAAAALHHRDMEEGFSSSAV
ncbi:hypothetical protein [Muricoccus vinaceus]|uniref:Uncharacterized protein n=1 Tax=Muricoccus vinaceus TaxID=424704 RepID=A0ABV6IYI5_9PROT